MKLKLIKLDCYFSIIIFLSAFSGISASARSTGTQVSRTATAELRNSSKEKVGTAILTQTNQGVRISIQVSNLPPGQHGIHFHEKGICAPPKFESAAAHFNPERKEHGLKNPKGHHAGDLPNLEVKEDGTGSMEMTTKIATLRKGKNSLLKQGGTALVIHANPDNQRSNPSGDSGDRIACGVVKQSP